MVKSQIDNLIHGLSFAHNLCCWYSNGWCKPILDIYVLRNFQWYKYVFNPMSFDPPNYSLKIRLQPLKCESTWECVGSFPHIVSHSQECECEPQVALSACTFPCFCLGFEPKTKIMTIKLIMDIHLVLMFYNILLPLVSLISINSVNSKCFLGLWLNKHINIIKMFQCKIPKVNVKGFVWPN
jgi:hypothetical protein